MPSWLESIAGAAVTVRIVGAEFVDGSGVVHTGAEAIAAFILQFYDPLDFYLAQLGDA